MSADAGYAVWWLFSAEMAFEGWYVNLERRAHIADAIDVIDHELDIVVDPDGVWRWKDEESFVSKIGHPAYWSHKEASAIRAEGERATRLIEAGAYPFDGSWCDFSPPKTWDLPELPQPPRIRADMVKAPPGGGEPSR
jgi:protein associated with RNAse G/E